MQELEKILEEIESMEYPAEGIGCGLEDISITDRYESAEYGWNEAVERITEIIRKHMNDGWIPVEERLPEYGKKVLSYGKSGEIDIASLYSRDKHMWLVGSMCSVAFDIIAWRPLPEPYRPERSEE